jgi:tripartite-type tricarboxylate transporter receptor subunit TctC
LVACIHSYASDILLHWRICAATIEVVPETRSVIGKPSILDGRKTTSMNTFRTLTCFVAVVVAFGMSAARRANAEYPDRIIKLVVPYLPGGGTDVVARHFAEEFGRAIGQSVIVENRAGAGGLVGIESVINAEPDGYTFVVGDNSTNSFVPALAKTPRYNPVVDLTPISLLVDVPNVFTVPAEFPAKSIADVIELAKQKPGFYNSGTAGIGSFSHVAIELMNVMAGTQIICVPYKGGAEALPAVLKAEVQSEIMPLRNAIPYIKSGQLRALAVTSQKRSTFIPEVPTMAETIPNYSADNWYGLYAPGKLPKEILAKAAAAVKQAMESEVMENYAKADGTTIRMTSPEQFKDLAREDYEKWAKLIDVVHIPKN